MNVIKIDSYIIKNAHIYHEKDTYEVLTALIVKPLNDEMKLIMNEKICMFILWGMKIKN